MSDIPFLNLERQTSAIRPELDEATRRVLDGGRFVLGDEGEAFEAEFAAYCGATHSVGVGSGTNAITIGLRALGVGEGDEVITVANSCVPTVVGIERAGATPVLADADEFTMTIDISSVERALTPRTRAVIPVHLYVRPVDFEPLASLARRKGLLILEDAAQAHGAELGGRRIGSLGDAAAFSFYPTKNLGALGDAGAIVTSDPAVSERARMLRNYGERARYQSLLRGTNSRLDEVQAAWLRVKLRHLDGWTSRRREIAIAYRDAFANRVQLQEAVSDGRHAYHLFVMRVVDRDNFRRSLAKRGVQTLVHYPSAIHQQPAYASLGNDKDLGVSELLAHEVVSLPLYPELTDAEVEHVIAAVRAAST